jgi:hypothetical protein
MGEDSQANLREALKRVAVALKQSDIPFALMGGYAVWARGGPEPAHDVDFMVAAEDEERAERYLADQGFKVERPPEDWLFKVHTDDTVVDIIFRDSGEPATRQVVQDASEIEVISVLMPVLSATELMVQKINAMDEHYCDYGRMLPVGRALREQVDWPRVRKETEHNDFGAAYLFLLERLHVIDPEPL